MTKTLPFALAMLALGVATASQAQPNSPDTDADGGAVPPTLPVPAGPGWQVAFNVGAQSDYVFRGISQTDERPSGFAGVDVTYQQQWYVGGWTSNVDFRPSGDTSTRQEFDLYGGWRPTLAGINLDLGYIYYGYRDEPVGLRESYAETYLRGSHAFGPVTIGAAVFYSNNFPGSSRHAVYGEANVAYAIDSAWTLSAALGRQAIAHALTYADGSNGNFNYTTWNAGTTWSINDHITLDVRYWDTNTHESGDIYGARVAGALKATF